MQLLRWAPMLCLGNALVSAIPLPNCHKFRLPFVPSPEDLANGVRSSLSIDWSIQNGSLYANDDKVYPPSTTMRLRAPLLESVDQLHPGDKTVEVSYTLDSRPLSTDPLGSVVRVRFEFLDLHGNLVSPNAVAVDLLTYQNGDHHITRIRIEPARGGGDEDRFTQKSRPWVVKYWRTQFGSIFETKAALPTHGSNSAPESPSRSGDSDVTNSASTSGSRSRFPISSFWAASNPAYPNHRSGHYTHGYRPKSSLMQIIRPIILPAVLGAVAGLVACVVGFFVGHLLMSLAIRLGWQGAVRRPRTLSSEEWSSEKSPMVPHIYVANVPGSDV